MWKTNEVFCEQFFHKSSETALPDSTGLKYITVCSGSSDLRPFTDVILLQQWFECEVQGDVAKRQNLESDFLFGGFLRQESLRAKVTNG